VERGRLREGRALAYAALPGMKARHVQVPVSLRIHGELGAGRRGRGLGPWDGDSGEHVGSVAGGGRGEIAVGQGTLSK
jgi:hypothetical protein